MSSFFEVLLALPALTNAAVRIRELCPRILEAAHPRRAEAMRRVAKDICPAVDYMHHRNSWPMLGIPDLEAELVVLTIDLRDLGLRWPNNGEEATWMRALIRAGQLREARRIFPAKRRRLPARLLPPRLVATLLTRRPFLGDATGQA